MGPWILLLLHLHLANATALPAPFNVSISSFNLWHTVSFLPGVGTPSNARFTVEIICIRKILWKQVEGCSELTAGQTCNITKMFKNLLSHYQARVQAYTPSQRSSWTVSKQFQPLSDTVLGPPEVSVSGCGNCLIVQLKAPSTGRVQHDLLLKSVYTGLHFHVKRTRDGAEFTINTEYREENVISYLQPGVEYCVTVSVKALFNSQSPDSSKRHCAFTSPPPPPSPMYLVFGLLSTLCILGVLVVGLFVYGGQLNFTLLKHCVCRTLTADPTLCSGT